MDISAGFPQRSVASLSASHHCFFCLLQCVVPRTPVTGYACASHFQDQHLRKSSVIQNLCLTDKLVNSRLSSARPAASHSYNEHELVSVSNGKVRNVK